MRVLSLFDGMSCGQIALRELGIIPEIYYASEIDKHAIKQTQLNFPETVQLGDVTKWREWDIDFSKIDLLLAGSPCQGFSIAGKQLAFDDPRSVLFFVFIEIRNHIRTLNPNILFLLENVDMKRAHLRIINEYCGLHPVMINSALVSAQNRERWYWTNIHTRSEGLFGELYTDIPQPEDRGIVLRDILEDEVDEKYYVSDAVLARLQRKNYSQPKIDPDKAGTLNTKNNSGQMSLDSGTTFITQRGRGKNAGNNHYYKSPTLSAHAWEQNNLIIEHGIKQVDGVEDTGNWDNPQQDRNICGVRRRIRRITPTEASRLQTIPASYRWACSDTQVYRMTGNGWTVEVIKHFFSFIPQVQPLKNDKKDRPDRRRGCGKPHHRGSRINTVSGPAICGNICEQNQPHPGIATGGDENRQGPTR